MAGRRVKLTQEIREIGEDVAAETGERVPKESAQRRTYFQQLGEYVIVREAALRREDEERTRQAREAAEAKQRHETIAHYNESYGSALLALAQHVGGLKKRSAIPAGGKKTAEENKAPAKVESSALGAAGTSIAIPAPAPAPAKK